jgi:hypothetical protein
MSYKGPCETQRARGAKNDVWYCHFFQKLHFVRKKGLLKGLKKEDRDVNSKLKKRD